MMAMGLDILCRWDVSAESRVVGFMWGAEEMGMKACISSQALRFLDYSAYVVH